MFPSLLAAGLNLLTLAAPAQHPAPAAEPEAVVLPKEEAKGRPVRAHAAPAVPVVAAGGPKAKNLRQALTAMSEVVQAGGRGATIGRNIWGVSKVAETVRAFKAVILEGRSVDAALAAEGLTGEE